MTIFIYFNYHIVLNFPNAISFPSLCYKIIVISKPIYCSLFSSATMSLRRVSCSNYSYLNYSNILRYSNLEYFWSNIRTIRIPKNLPNWPIFRQSEPFFPSNSPSLDSIFKKPWTYVTINSIAIKWDYK